jgi:hypothetical protein
MVILDRFAAHRRFTKRVLFAAGSAVLRRGQTALSIGDHQEKTGFLIDQKPRLVQLVPAAGLEPATS